MPILPIPKIRRAASRRADYLALCDAEDAKLVNAVVRASALDLIVGDPSQALKQKLGKSKHRKRTENEERAGICDDEDAALIAGVAKVVAEYLLRRNRPK